jgi:hypothetical protein
MGHPVNDSHFGFKAGHGALGCVAGSVRVCAVNQGDGSASHTSAGPPRLPPPCKVLAKSCSFLCRWVIYGPFVNASFSAVSFVSK